MCQGYLPGVQPCARMGCDAWSETGTLEEVQGGCAGAEVSEGGAESEAAMGEREGADESPHPRGGRGLQSCVVPFPGCYTSLSTAPPSLIPPPQVLQTPYESPVRQRCLPQKPDSSLHEEKLSLFFPEEAARANKL
uniref:Uncharacterized protein n=1 Tax=Pipistrellus kuhlii TaxID=59472 RepID=A0A7J7XBU4_PIPKU|nr:hypothetical protein mPipKuh1_010614 [Pipistrellus kuhlii]